MSERYPTINEVSSKYGAPMGRTEFGTDMHAEDKSIRVFRIPINSGGYDSGGAYWGFGKPLYCATDGDSYRQFVRANDRQDAIEKLDIDAAKLIRK